MDTKMRLHEWAIKWTIPALALQELTDLFILPQATAGKDIKQSESAIQSLIRLEASRKGLRLWRNNVGACFTESGSFLRYGLANDSPAVNKVIKSADLIGIRPVVITGEMLGRTIGQFVSREVKAVDWKYKGTLREKAQLAWAKLIVSLGGDACFANGEGTL